MQKVMVITISKISGPECGRDKNGTFHCKCGNCTGSDTGKLTREIIVSYPKLDGMEPLIITNSRQEAVRFIQKGFTICFIPQMFLSDTGVYGLHPADEPIERTEDEADRWLTEEEDKMRKHMTGNWKKVR